MFRDKKPFNLRVELDPAPIRHIAVQCPRCQKWFYGHEIAAEGCSLMYDYQIEFTTFTCPLCHEDFGYGTEYSNDHIERSSHPEIYDGVLTKKTVWE
jgi:transposase-like protein